MDPNSAYRRALEKAQAEVPAAIRQLGCSERGQGALFDFRAMLQNGAIGLDCRNWAALAKLLTGGMTKEEVAATLDGTLYRSPRGRRAVNDIIALFRKRR